MIECNRCARRSCDIIGMFRHDKGMFKTFHLRQNCKQYVPQPLFKEQLLLLTLASNPQSLHDVLESHHMKLKELADPPWFKIVHKKGA